MQAGSQTSERRCVSERRGHEGRGAAACGRGVWGGEIFEFFYIKWRVLVHSGAWILNLIMCQSALVLIIK